MDGVDIALVETDGGREIFSVAPRHFLTTKGPRIALGSQHTRSVSRMGAGRCGAQGCRAPVWMIVPTCSPRSAAVIRPGTSPFTICTRSR